MRGVPREREVHGRLPVASRLSAADEPARQAWIFIQQLHFELVLAQDKGISATAQGMVWAQQAGTLEQIMRFPDLRARTRLVEALSAYAWALKTGQDLGDFRPPWSDARVETP